MLIIPYIKIDSPDTRHRLMREKGLKADLVNNQWADDATSQDIFTTLYLAHDKHFLLLNFDVVEKNVRATFTEHLCNIFEDSCVEFFFRDENSIEYTNIEINPYGKALVAYGSSRQGRVLQSLQYIQSLNINSTYKDDEDYRGRWSISYQIPFKEITPQTIVYANAYKCGERTIHPPLYNVI